MTVLMVVVPVVPLCRVWDGLEIWKYMEFGRVLELMESLCGVYAEFETVCKRLREFGNSW